MLLFHHPAGIAHETGVGHPERPERLRAILRTLERDYYPWLDRREAPRATLEAVARAHPRVHVEGLLAAMPEHGLCRIDGDTIASPGTAEAALRAAGGAMAAVDAVVAGPATRAFVAMRPPGHHAERSQAMGFCFFNNVAVAALHARAVHGIQRIAIVDFDVHHGNGTQDIFWDDADTLYVSTHQAPLYPHSGAADERGAHGTILNLPLPAGTDGAAYRRVLDERILPALDAFAPELLLLSAGFDAYKGDPLAQLALEIEDFGWITRALVQAAERHAAGRVVSVLEGGYDTRALGACVLAHLEALDEL